MADRSSAITHGEPNGSTRAILEDVLRDVTNIVRAEVRLARAELKDDLRTARRSAGLFGAAALCGGLAAASLTACAVAALALVMPVWIAAALTAIGLVSIGGGLYAAGRDRLKKAKPALEETQREARSTYQWLKQLTR